MLSGCLIAQAVYPPRNRGNSSRTLARVHGQIGTDSDSALPCRHDNPLGPDYEQLIPPRRVRRRQPLPSHAPLRLYSLSRIGQ